jgi:hypothetical protein
LRQGDPLSPLLFNLVVDALGVMLQKVVSRGHINGVLEDLFPGGISHIQYADNTLIMVDGSDKSIINLKLILYCFEWLTGLKINFHKSEVFIFGVPQAEKERMANMLNYVLGELPWKYLGIPSVWGLFLQFVRKCSKGWTPGEVSTSPRVGDKS